MLVNAPNAAYEETYIAMLQGDDENCSIYCDTYYAAVDTLTPVEALTVQKTVNVENSEAVPYGVAENAWTSLKANVAELESTKEGQFEDVYQPQPVWQRPVGHAAQGIDVFEVLCHVNCLKEAAAVVVGDSGAVLP